MDVGDTVRVIATGQLVVLEQYRGDEEWPFWVCSYPTLLCRNGCSFEENELELVYSKYITPDEVQNTKKYLQ